MFIKKTNPSNKVQKAALMIQNIPHNLKRYFRLDLLIYVLVCSLVLFRGVLYNLDSHAFLSMEINRSSGYIIFLSFFRSVFGNYFEFPLLIVQLAINIYGVYGIHTCLKKIVRLEYIFSILSLIIFCAPLLYLYFTANKIATEALAYPLYLIFVTNCLYGVVLQQKRNFIYSAITLLILILVRGQFLSLVPVGLIMIIFVIYISKKKSYLLIIALFLMIPFISNILDKSFHYYQHGYFVATPFTGPTINASVFYVSDKEDIDLFDSKEEKEYFKLVKEKLDREEWTSTFANTHDSISSFSHFRQNYSNICNQTIHEYGLRYFEQKGLSSDLQYIETNKLTLKMYQPLLLDNFKEWLKLYIQNIKASLGNSKNLLLHVILFGVGIFLIVKRKDLVIGKFMVLILLCTFANIAVLAVATDSQKRYMFYNDWVLFIILFVFLDRYFKTLKNVNNQ